MRHEPTGATVTTPPRPDQDGPLFSESVTSLDRHEITVDPLKPTLCVSWRHSGWARLRRTTFDAITRCSGSHSRLERFANCGSAAWIAHAEGDTKRVRILADYCHDRFCRPCATAKARRLADALVAFVDGRRIRLITFTLKSSLDPLKDQIKRLQKCFRRLRQREWWTEHVDGGVATIEVTRNDETGLWHPHLHVIATGRYLPHPELSRHWHSVTGDSQIVDVRDAGGIEATCRYVAKYVSKGVPASVMHNVDLACEVVAAFTGVRGYTTFGSWHGFAVTKRTDDTVWIKIAPLESVIAAAHRGDPRADALLEILRPKGFEHNSTGNPLPGSRPP